MADAIYALANGTNKSRLSNSGNYKLVDEIDPFHISAICTGEQGLHELIQTAGGRQRLIQLDDILPVTDTTLELVDNVKNMIQDNLTLSHFLSRLSLSIIIFI
jgi:hypothetical protein